MGLPADAFLKNSTTKVINKFEKSIVKHIKKLDDGVDFIFVDFKHFNKKQINKFKKQIDDAGVSNRFKFINDGGSANPKKVNGG